MKICNRCRTQLDDIADSCPKCGSKSFAPMTQMNNQQAVNNIYQQPQQNWQAQQQINQPIMQQQMHNGNMQSNMYQQPQQNWQQTHPNQMPQQGQGQFNPNPYAQQQQINQNINVIRPNMQPHTQSNVQQQQPAEPDPLAVPPKKGFLGLGKKEQKTPAIQNNVGQTQQNYGVTTNQGVYTPNQNQMGQPYGQQTPYGQNIPPVNVDPLQDNNTDMTVSDWIKTLLILLIPIYNLVFIIKGMNNVKYPMYKRNYFKAYLIYFLASLGISVVFALLLTLL